MPGSLKVHTSEDWKSSSNNGLLIACIEDSSVASLNLYCNLVADAVVQLASADAGQLGVVVLADDFEELDYLVLPATDNRENERNDFALLDFSQLAVLVELFLDSLLFAFFQAVVGSWV